MSDPFNNKYNALDQDGDDSSYDFIIRPKEVRQSPRRSKHDPFDDEEQEVDVAGKFDREFSSPSPSKAAMKYSPMVSFGKRRDLGPGSPDRETPRARFTARESPTRAQHVPIVPLQTEKDEYDDQSLNSFASEADKESIGSPSRFKRSPTRVSLGRSITSSKSQRMLSPPKPIFSASTFAAANSDQSEYSEAHHIGKVPDLQPRSSYDSNETAVDEMDLSEKYLEKEAQDLKRDTESTLYGDNQSMYNEQYPVDVDDLEEWSNFGSNLDGQVFATLPANYQPRRKNHLATQVKYASKNGNLILNNPIPDKLLQFQPLKEEEEFQFMRYSAVTADADNFINEGFSLRASSEYGRETELVICITMYNENEDAFTRTMHAVMKNIAYLCKRNNSKKWGHDSWKKVVVVVIADGRQKMNVGALNVLAGIGVYQQGIAKSLVNNKPVQAHLFEYTTQVSINEDLKFTGCEKGVVPVQVVLCLKENNTKKINSHRWLFNAMCQSLRPNVCVLLDVGTRPDTKTIYNLWKAFDQDSNVAGAAGEIVSMKGKYWSKLLNPLVASQNFEYKMSNILDKPFESVFGYISVLPGALSAYRYSALQNHEDGTGPLNSYFKGETNEKDKKGNVLTNVFNANMYLAEDRILCWELVAKRDEKWVLKYVSSATGETDVPEALPEFISQRRRWLNGAFFAALYAQTHFRAIWNTDHSLSRKLFFHLEFFYQFIQLFFSMFSLANFYIAFYYLVGSLASNKSIPGRGGFWIFQVLNYICLCNLTAIFMISMGNRPQGAPHLYMISLLILVVCGVVALICGFVYLVDTINQKSMGNLDSSDGTFVSIVISLASTYGLDTVMSLLYLEPWHILTSALQYFIMLPAYTCMLQIYAFCNTHDVTWGTKGDNNLELDLGTAVMKVDDDGQEFFEFEVVSDINNSYDEVLFKLKSRRQIPKKARYEETVSKPSDKDYYRDVRTRVVLFWLIANLVLVMTVTQIYEPGSFHKNNYLAFILWSVFALAVFRGIGSICYLAHKWLRVIVQAKNRWSYKRFEQKYQSPGSEPI